ncbi:hypothetical protein ACRALDRAFT_1073110 [Sodiomyces alcalophilus JCM 7366]|uniref:uncharacterized protein n=1 Tax=Sodiomyces alcalophilus JCM 7366 TaxID=591952 RepID=UPI0039B69EFE
MTRPAGIPARSNHGCWTCRVRKKKCDETHPQCNVCVSLGLECHGYGPRPEWIDNKTLQREQSVKFKQMVSQSKSRKSTQTLLSTTDAPHKLDGSQSLLMAEHVKSPTGPPSSSSHQRVQGWKGHGGNATRDNLFWHQGGRENAMPSTVRAAWNEPLHDCSVPSAYPPLFDSGQYLATPSLSSASSLSPGLSEWGPAPSPDMSDVHDLDIWTGYDASGTSPLNFEDSVLYQSFQADAQKATPHDFIGSKAGARTHTVGVGDLSPPVQSTSWSMAQISQSIFCAGAEDALLMHYLDHVFYSQFPFYRSHNGRGRGWLLSILKRVEPAYYAALALSERDLASRLPGSSTGNDGSDGSSSSSSFVPPSLAGKRHYDLALQGLQSIVDDPSTWDEHTRLVRSLECLTTILLLLFWEILYGGKKNWQALLRTGSSFISAIVQSQNIRSADRSCVGELRCERTPYPGGAQSAIVFLLDSFISFDIISCASTRGPPFLDINHAQTLKNFDIPMENFSGCRSSVMGLISDVSLLDRWRNESQAASRLSIVDLAKRAGQIEERLRQELAEITRDMQLTAAAESPKADTAGMHSAQISQLFALAAIIYLHVVVSGAHPELPEIAQTVSEIVDALGKLIEDPRLLRSVVWPFCVAGCVALEEQQAFFRNVLTPREVAKYSTKTCHEALYIMEKCWTTRKIDLQHCDWATIMSKFGHYILLI